MYGGQIQPTFPSGRLPDDYFTADRGILLIGVGSAFIVLECIAFGLRVWARRLRRLRFGWDDALMIPGLFFNLLLAVLSIVSVPVSDTGKHTLVSFIRHPNHEFGLINGLIMVPCIYIFAVVCAKGAILNLFLRIFTIGIERRITQITIVFIAVHACISVPINIFQCNPISATWKINAAGKCIDPILFFKWSCIPNVFTDFVMLIMPLPSVWRLKASLKMKIGVTAMLLTATIGIIASVIRSVEFFIPSHVFSDPTWYAVELYACSLAEPGTYFLAACGSNYKVFGKHFTSEKFRSLLARCHVGSHLFARTSVNGEKGGREADALRQEKLQAPHANTKAAARGFDSLLLSEIERVTSNSGATGGSISPREEIEEMGTLMCKAAEANVP